MTLWQSLCCTVSSETARTLSRVRVRVGNTLYPSHFCTLHLPNIFILTFTLHYLTLNFNLLFTMGWSLTVIFCPTLSNITSDYYRPRSRCNTSVFHTVQMYTCMINRKVVILSVVQYCQHWSLIVVNTVGLHCTLTRLGYGVMVRVLPLTKLIHIPLPLPFTLTLIRIPLYPFTLKLDWALRPIPCRIKYV